MSTKWTFSLWPRWPLSTLLSSISGHQVTGRGDRITGKDTSNWCSSAMRQSLLSFLRILLSYANLTLRPRPCETKAAMWAKDKDTRLLCCPIFWSLDLSLKNGLGVCTCVCTHVVDPISAPHLVVIQLQLKSHNLMNKSELYCLER